MLFRRAKKTCPFMKRGVKKAIFKNRHSLFSFEHSHERRLICHKHNNLETQMLIGLAHDRIIYLGMTYIERGYITQDEYENLYEYLYKPYEKLGGNGSAKRIMTEVDQLAIHKSTYNA